MRRADLSHPPATIRSVPAVPPDPAELQADAADAPETADAPDEAPPRRETVVDAAGHGRRLDQLLVSLAPEYSRSHLQTLVEQGQVEVDGRAVLTPSRRLRAGQRVSIDLVLPPAERPVVGEPMALAIVHEDADLLVLDKPAGLVVHPAAGHWSGTLMNGLIAHHPGAAALPRAGIVHRLDKDTSGLMVVAKTLPAMVALARDIAARSVRREYLAIAHGRLPRSPLSIEAPIGRDPVSRVRMAVVPGARPARTDVETLASADGLSCLRCRLHTGRTHQIRVHLASLGCPLVADALYGGAVALGLRRQALHAWRLSFEHPARHEPVAFEAPLPPDLQVAWESLTDPGATRPRTGGEGD